MSKKNKFHEASNSRDGAASAIHAAEYRIIKFDLIKVVILNVVYLAVILTLYFTNKNTQYLEHWFAKILHF